MFLFSFAITGWILYFLLTIILRILQAILADRKERPRRAPYSTPAPTELPFNWRRADTVVPYFYPAYREAVREEYAFFQAVIAPLAGRRDLLLELYRAHTLPQLSTQVPLFRALHFWYGRRARRPIGDWQPENRTFPSLRAYFDELIAFLFAEHPAAPLLNQVWWDWDHPVWQEFIHRVSAEEPFLPEQNPDNAAFWLYFYVTEGSNPAKAPFLNWELGRGAVRYFLEAPPELTPRQAFWRAILLAEGGRREARHWEAEGFPAPAGFQETAFWRDFYRLLMRETTAPPTETVRRTIEKIDWLRFGLGSVDWTGHYGSLRGSEPAFSFKGRSWRSLLRYLRDRFRFLPPAGRKEREEWTGADGNRYLFLFLDSPTALLEEGGAMGHCLGNEGHVELAAAGTHSYWSLRRRTTAGQEEQLATFTLHQGTIIEWAGVYHDAPEEVEGQVVQAWLNKAGQWEAVQ